MVERKKPMAESRSYQDKDLKILLGRSANRCAEPGCRVLCMTMEERRDDVTMLGEIAHIHAKSPKGPRFNADLSEKQRDAYDNLLWLCLGHHKIVDNKANEHIYSADLLRSWKRDVEAWVSQQLQTLDVPEEVSTLLNFMVNEVSAIVGIVDFKLLPVEAKIKKNAFSLPVQRDLAAALVQCPQVGRFVQGLDGLQVGWSERLVGAFQLEYLKHKGKASSTDEIYYALREFASRGRKDLASLAAGGQIVVYLFERCEIFEK